MTIKARLERLTRTLGTGADRPLWDGVDTLTEQETRSLMSHGSTPLRPGAERLMGALFLDIGVRCILAGEKDDTDFVRDYVDDLDIQPYDDTESILRKALEYARADLHLTPAELVELRRWIVDRPPRTFAAGGPP